jgi:hypothetical protein
MPDIDVFYDTDGSAWEPTTAVAILSETNTHNYLVRHSFIDMWNGQNPPAYPALQGTQAIVMMGTTEELQQDLADAMIAGVQAIQIPGDMLAIYYVRRLRGGYGPLVRQNTETVVVIAPAVGYWSLPPMQVPAGRIGDWEVMYPYYVYDGGISLQVLKDEIIPVADGKPGKRY